MIIVLLEAADYDYVMNIDVLYAVCLFLHGLLHNLFQLIVIAMFQID